ncbi:hypothetical protein CTEN210_02978 [Chaetoceros tenuissimus]|uniref:Uncharacterized protein n=1 Tax=Chaetoceros tenuissimus TaxID=426638 RepID=A0AAD3H1K2_9STRA|nr:hypothetical protein CTEN210_02978 [Chaetoceros tenuissimus]
MVSLTQEIIDLQSHLRCIQDIKEDWRDDDCRKKIMDAIQNTRKLLSDAFGQSLHNLEVFRPNENAVEKVVEEFPESIAFENDKGNLPIHSTTANDHNISSLKYIPLLAREGVRHNVGGEGNRGGLLGGNISGSRNCLQNLVSTGHLFVQNKDDQSVKILKKLKEEGLLVKDDITDHDLIYWSGGEWMVKRFKFFLQWDPNAVVNYSKDDLPLMHHFATDHFDDFKAVLGVMFECYPNEAGHLFQKDNAGITAFEKAWKSYGEEKVMKAINSIFSPQTSFPILHHALIQAPKYKDAFMEWFPWAFHLRDHNDRTLIQTMLATGANCVKEYKTVFASMSDDQIRTKDPVTTLYPFAAVARGEEGDLQKSFYLLRRQPDVLQRHG